MAQGRPGQVKEAKDVRAKDPFDVLRGQILDAADFSLFSRIVDQNIDAIESFERLLDDVFTEFWFCKVSVAFDYAASHLLYSRHGLFGIFVLIQISDANVGPFFGKKNGDRTSNAAVRASHDSDLALQFTGRLVIFVLINRLRPHLSLRSWRVLFLGREFRVSLWQRRGHIEIISSAVGVPCGCTGFYPGLPFERCSF
jgi:hypothetical protein